MKRKIIAFLISSLLLVNTIGVCDVKADSVQDNYEFEYEDDIVDEIQTDDESVDKDVEDSDSIEDNDNRDVTDNGDDGTESEIDNDDTSESGNIDGEIIFEQDEIEDESENFEFVESDIETVRDYAGVRDVQELSNPIVVLDSSKKQTGVIWNCIYYGEYPQSMVSEDSTEYERLSAATEWDVNGDTIVDGIKYRKNGNVFYKYEPIKWRVLKVEDGKALLLSDIILDAKKFCEYGSLYYENSTVRSWLNGYGPSENTKAKNFSGIGFVDIAFTAEEKEFIMEQVLDKENESNYIEPRYVIDKVFLMSAKEVSDSAYGAADYGLMTNDARNAIGSDYEKSLCNESWWWLRSYKFIYNYPSYANTYAINRVIEGGVGYNADAKVIAGIRPSIWLDLSSEYWRNADIAEGGHVYDDGVLQKKPTLTETGENLYTCIGCGATKITSIPRLYTTSIENLTINLPNETCMFDTTEQRPKVTINGLVEGEDFEVIYSNNINPGVAKITVNGINGMTGTKSLTFTIHRNIAYEDIKINYDKTYYDGEEKRPVVTIKGFKQTSVDDIRGDYGSYTVRYESNIEAGTAYIYLTGVGGLKGSTVRTFEIIKHQGGEVIKKNIFNESKDVQWYVFDDGTLIFEGTGTIVGADEYVHSKIPEYLEPQYYNECPLRRIIIGEGITEVVGSFHCSYDQGTQSGVLISLEELVLPSTLTKVSDRAFGGLQVEKLHIPGSLKNIGLGTFAGNKLLREVIIDEGVEYIDAQAFADCWALERIELPDSLKSFGLRYNDKLKSIDLPPNLETLDFYGCFGLESIYLPDSVSDIYLRSCWNLASVRMPQGGKLKEIRQYAFDDCISLESIEIPEGVETINDTFKGCTKLKEVSFPSTLRHVSGFSSCPELRHVEFNDGLLTVSGFGGCNIKFVRIPSSVVHAGGIGNQSLEYQGRHNNRVIKYYVWENSDHEAELMDASFANTNFLTDIVVLPYNCKIDTNHIGNKYDAVYQVEHLYLFEGCFLDQHERIKNSQYDYGCDGQGLKLGSPIVNILDYGPCGRYAEYVITKNGTLRIFADGAMDDYVRPEDTPWYSMRDIIVEIEVLDGVTHIGDNAFSGLSNVTSIYVSRDVESIGRNVFDGCDKLVVVDDIGSVLSKYIYKYYPEIENEGISGKCGNGMEWKIEDSVLCIYGSGDMYDFTRANSPWIGYRDIITAVNIGEGITGIGSYAFWNLHKVTRISGLDNISRVGEYAFALMPEIEGISLIGAISIGQGAFLNCTSLEELSLGSSLKSLSFTCVGGCSSLKSVAILNDIAELKDLNYASGQDIYWVIDRETVLETYLDEYGIKYRYSDDVVIEEITVTNNNETNTYNLHDYPSVTLSCTVFPDNATYKNVRWISSDESIASVTPDGTVALLNEGTVTICAIALDGSRVSGKIDLVVQDKDGHAWENDYTVDMDATCNEVGQKSVHCSMCDARDSIVVIPESGHTYTIDIVIKDAECDRAGLSFRSCVVCGKAEYIAINPAGHSWETEYTVDRLAGCIELGEKSIHCAICGSRKEITDIEATGHVWEDHYTIECQATSDENGWESIHCSLCNEKKDIRIIPAYGDNETEMLIPKNSVVLYGTSLTLDGEIGINYYFGLPEELICYEGAYVIIKHNSDETVQYLSTIPVQNKNGKSMYRISAYVNAKEMNDKVTIQFVGEDGVSYGICSENGSYFGYRFVYSVDKYLTTVAKSSEYDSELKDLSLAMKNYGAYAQQYFGYDVSSAQIPEEGIKAVDMSALEEYAFCASGELDGFSYIGTSLQLESRTKIRIYFRADNVDEISIYCKDKQLEIMNISSQLCYVEIDNISAAEIDEIYSITVKDSSSNSIILESGVLSYVYDAINGSLDENLRNLVYSLYWYNKAADSYFMKHNAA